MKIHEAIAQSKAPHISLEFFPPKTQAGLDDFYKAAQRLKVLNPLFASVTYGAGGSTQDRTLEIAEYIKHTLGITTMPHLTCVNATSDSIRDFLKQLRGIGIQNVLALRGDAPADADFSWDNCEFKSALDLVKFIRTVDSELSVGVAGYPSPHPDATTVSAELAYTRDKIQAGANFIVTQLFFDVRAYIDFVERLRALGVTVPVLPGILPIQSLDSVRRILSMCGASIPGAFYLDLEKAHEDGGTPAVSRAGTEFAIEQCRDLLAAGAPGVHLYTLNRAETCLHIAEQIVLR